jgi:hypothetical protein
MKQREGLRVRSCAFLVCCVCLVASGLLAQEATKTGAATAAPTARNVKDVYGAVEVDRFKIQNGVEFPPEYLDALQKEITKQLAEAKLFEEVIPAGQKPVDSSRRVLQLAGLITNYNPGNRAQRYFGGFGAGAAEIDSKIDFLDGATDQPVLSGDLRAVLAGGFLGGKAEGALKDYARQVVNKAKLMAHMRLPAPGSTPNSPMTQSAGSEAQQASARHNITISQKDWPGSQQKLDQEAAQGYRVVSVTISGKYTADVELERADAIADQYQYRLLHPLMSTSLQKDINKATAEGYRVTPNSLVVLATSLTLIMEKSSPPFPEQYRYAVKETVLVSSGQKDTEKLQNQGFTLIGESEHGTNHVLLFEKTGGAPGTKPR